MKHLESNNILYDLQHGFRSSRSCETQLTSFIQELAKNNNDKIQTDAIVMGSMILESIQVNEIGL
jgi:hypothetical protein